MADATQPKEVWAKLFVVDGEQVLFYLEPNGADDEEGITLHMVTYMDGISCDVKIAWNNVTDGKPEKFFATLDEDAARNTLKVRRDMVG